jgi:hypothetical protein
MAAIFIFEIKHLINALLAVFFGLFAYVVIKGYRARAQFARFKAQGLVWIQSS